MILDDSRLWGEIYYAMITLTWNKIPLTTRESYLQDSDLITDLRGILTLVSINRALMEFPVGVPHRAPRSTDTFIITLAWDIFKSNGYVPYHDMKKASILWNKILALTKQEKIPKDLYSIEYCLALLNLNAAAAVDKLERGVNYSNAKS